MRKKESEVRKKMVVVRFNEQEHTQLLSLKAATTERTISNYLRKLALRKPVIIKYRNSSADDFLEHMVKLQKELHALDTNYNQAVKKLHLLEKIPEFRSWILIYDESRRSFLLKVDEIHSKVNQLYEQWLQK